MTNEEDYGPGDGDSAPGWSRRKLLKMSAAGAGVAATAGVGKAGYDEWQEFKTGPVSLSPDAGTLGYAFEEKTTTDEKRDLTVGGQTFPVTITTEQVSYGRSAEEMVGSPSVGLVRTPIATALGSRANPLADLSLRDLLRADAGKPFRQALDLGSVSWSRGPTEVGSSTGTALGRETTVKTFVGETDSGNLVLTNAAQVEVGGNVVFAGDVRTRSASADDQDGSLRDAIGRPTTAVSRGMFRDLLPFVVKQSPEKPLTATMEAENKKALRRYFEGWSNQNPKAIDKLISEDSQIHIASPMVPPDLPDGPEGWKTLNKTYHTVFPDAKITVRDLVAEGNIVSSRWAIEGTHQNAFMGVEPTGEEVEILAFEFAHFSDGQVDATWHLFDGFGLLQQLGVVEPPAELQGDSNRSESSGANPTEPSETGTTRQANKVVLRRYFQALSEGNTDALGEMIAPDAPLHVWPRSMVPADLPEGAKGHEQLAETYRSAFPDLTVEVEDQVAKGNTAVSRWTATGTHEGEFYGESATGEEVEFTGFKFARFADGRIVESWSLFDALRLLKQIEVVDVSLN